MQAYFPETRSYTKTNSLAKQLQEELARFRDLAVNQEMDDYYDAVDWLRNSCSFTNTGEIEYHGGDKNTPYRIPVKLPTESWHTLVEVEAQRAQVPLNPAVFGLMRMSEFV